MPRAMREMASLNPRASNGADIDLLTVSLDHLRRIALGGKLVRQVLRTNRPSRCQPLSGTDSDPRYTAVYLESNPVFTEVAPASGLPVETPRKRPEPLNLPQGPKASTTKVKGGKGGTSTTKVKGGTLLRQHHNTKKK